MTEHTDERLALAQGWTRKESKTRSCIEWPDESSCDGFDHDEDCEVLDRTHWYPKPGVGVFLPEWAEDAAACAKWLLPWLEEAAKWSVSIQKVGTGATEPWSASLNAGHGIQTGWGTTFAEAVTALCHAVLDALEKA